MSGKRIRRGLALVCLAAAAPAWAQTANIEVVTSYRVKPDRLGDFEAEIKEFNAVLQKTGAGRGYTTWSSLSGPAAYIRVDLYEKWAQLGEGQDPKLKEVATDLTRIGMRIYQCTDGRDRSIYTVRHDLSLEDAKQIPKMIELLRVRVAPDKMDEYVAAQKNYASLARKAGTQWLMVLQGRYGTSAREFVRMRGFEGWAALDGAPEKGESAQDLESERQYEVYRFEPELSYWPGGER